MPFEKEEKWLIPPNKEEQLANLLDFLEAANFNFAQFVSCFKRYIDEDNTGRLAEESTGN